ncbi:thiamine diphosphokinase, partial [Candidatus Woesebacteria bacterium]|nr:thiamine diphosphokinase [Candidatus Woesebacteria bacterium]
MTNRATIFLNGRRPTKKTIGAFNRPIMCSDGALKYVQPLGIAPDFVIGDFDSQTPENTKSNTVTYVELSDQNTTDFEKILAFSSERGVEKADVYGASGNEQDHFLGNLHAALRFKNTIDI